MLELSNDEIYRYSRHLIMPEVGLDGQLKLKAARVLCVGTGGLGAPCSLYLAAAGVGTLGLVDFDKVDHTNLQRQVLFTDADVGRPKIQVAVERLRALNPHIEIRAHEARFSSANAMQIAKDYDYVVDGTDNFPTRYLVNDVCVLGRKTNIYASIFRFEGQCTVFDARRGPCYRCLYPEPPPPGVVPSCAEGGVLGILPGVLGVLQATECVKQILGVGEGLIGRLLLFNALKMSFRELKLQKSPECPICSDAPTIKDLIDYEAFCGIQPQPQGGVGVEITPAELAEVLKGSSKPTLIDVREPHEYQICHIADSKLLPMSEFMERLAELDSSQDYVVYCHHGVRSLNALHFLRQAGFTKVKSLRGGIDAWSLQVDPKVPRY
jgi:molybdopterin/thiamine biosynthesis adenylyltransferase/rhodanese-related sulfurtransferase